MGRIEFARETDEEAAIRALQFVRVTIGGPNITTSGYLTDASAKMFWAHLKHVGFKFERSD